HQRRFAREIRGDHAVLPRRPMSGVSSSSLERGPFQLKEAVHTIIAWSAPARRSKSPPGVTPVPEGDCRGGFWPPRNDRPWVGAIRSASERVSCIAEAALAGGYSMTARNRGPRRIWGGLRREPREETPMHRDDYARYDGLGLAELVAKKEVSPRELALAARDAIAAGNPAINAVV